MLYTTRLQNGITTFELMAKTVIPFNNLKNYLRFLYQNSMLNNLKSEFEESESFLIKS